MTGPLSPTNNHGAIAEGRATSQLKEASRMASGNSPLPMPFLEKVVVVEVLFDPSMIDDTRADYYVSTLNLKDTSFLRSLPPNTIIGKKVRDGTSSGAEELEYFFPFFPPFMMFPVKAGEHVWVFYENNKNNAYGFWWFRVNEPRNIDDLNQTHADRKFQGTAVKGPRDKATDPGDAVPGFDPAPSKKINGQDSLQGTGTSYGTDEKAYTDLITKSDAGKVHDFEAVPRFKKRPGDHVLQGSNNTLIVLGTDRTGAVAETTSDPDKGTVAKGKPSADQVGNAGTIDVVVGRGQDKSTAPKDVVTNTLSNQEVNKNVKKENPNEGDPDFNHDMARMYLSMNTAVDKNFSVQLTGIDPTTGGVVAGVIKADHVRIIARKSLMFLVQPSFDSGPSDCGGIVIKDTGDIVFVPSSKGIVKLGGDDADKALLGVDTSAGAQNAGGTVLAPAGIMSTMGGFVGIGGAQGIFCTKVMGK